MRKQILSIVIGIFIIIFITGYMSKEQAGEELIQYFNVDIRSEEDDRLSEAVSELLSLFIRAEDEEIAHFIKEEFLPASKDLIDYLEGLEYKSKGVRKLNQIDIDIQQSIYDTLVEYVEALEKGNAADLEDKLMEFERELDRETEKYFDERRKLIDKYDLESTREYDHGDTIYLLKKKDE